MLIDKSHLHVWDLARDRFVARKRISQQPLLAIFKSSGRCEFGVISGVAVDVWRVEQDLDYRIVLGGHTGPVIASDSSCAQTQIWSCLSWEECHTSDVKRLQNRCALLCHAHQHSRLPLLMGKHIQHNASQMCVVYFSLASFYTQHR